MAHIPYEEQQEEEGDYTGQYAAGSRAGSSSYQVPNNPYNGSIVLLTDPENTVLAIELMYRGQRLTSENQIEDVGEPLMNDEGVKNVMGAIRTIVNPVTIMGNLERNEIPLITDFMGDTLAKDLMMSMKKYEIPRETSRDMIYFTALTSSFMTMKRAYEEGDRRFWKGTTYEAVIRQQGETQNQGFVGKLLGWGGGKK